MCTRNDENISFATLGLLETQIRMKGIPKFPKKAKEGSSGLTTEEKWIGDPFDFPPAEVGLLESGLISACFTRAIAFRAISRSKGEEYTLSV